MIEAVIVAHGLWMPGIETVVLRQRLRSAGFRPSLFRFASMRGTLPQNAERLGRFAGEVEADRLHFVGYSLGGIVTLTLLAETPLPRLGRIVCLGSPLVGCSTANRLARVGVGRRILGRSLVEHDRRGGIARWEGAAELGVIAGNRSIGAGRLVGALTGPNDGTVAVDETRIPGTTDHVILPVTHTQMIFDAGVARQTIHFLRHGRFVR
jgi:pimeloyl-ACP methyl ester carboxylesterase